MKTGRNRAGHGLNEVGYGLGRSALQPRQRDMRTVFSLLGRQTCGPGDPFVDALHVLQGRIGFDFRHQNMRTFSAKAAQATDAGGKSGQKCAGKPSQDVVPHVPVDIAAEADGDMIVSGIDPAGTRHVRFQVAEPIFNLLWQPESGEKSRHDKSSQRLTVTL
jgi:hypothetical protein